jgi:hypothetical protein
MHFNFVTTFRSALEPTYILFRAQVAEAVKESEHVPPFLVYIKTYAAIPALPDMSS